MAKDKVSQKNKESSKKARVTKVVTPKDTKVEVRLKPKRKKQTAKNIQVVSGFERYKMIEVAAYYLAEKNSFSGSATDYWIEAEKLIDEKVSSNEQPVKAPSKASKAKKNSLLIIEGIGPKIAALLTDDGIASLSDLANASVSQLQDILSKAGPRYSIHKPDTWPEQAALAQDGNMDALNALQDELKGGKRQ